MLTSLCSRCGGIHRAKDCPLNKHGKLRRNRRGKHRARGKRKFKRREITPQQREQVRRAARYHCAACGRHDRNGQVDHIKPLSEGGSNGTFNLQFLCRRCHNAKTAQGNAEAYRQRMAQQAGEREAARRRKQVQRAARRHASAKSMLDGGLPG